MSTTLWTFEHAAECKAPREFVWAYWTDVRNWDDPPARFELDGAFALGARLTTILPGQRLESVVREVNDGREALIEMDFAGANVGFRWRFEEIAAQGTRMTQTIRLSGAAAEALLEQVRVLEANAPDGMKKLIAAIERKWFAEQP